MSNYLVRSHIAIRIVVFLNIIVNFIICILWYFKSLKIYNIVNEKCFMDRKIEEKENFINEIQYYQENGLCPILRMPIFEKNAILDLKFLEIRLFDQYLI